MHQTTVKNHSVATHVLLLSIVIVAGLFYWQGDKGFSLRDEGFLWYGAQRVMLGEVPKLDFKAYDPGRYYWSAALMGLSGSDGILALRGAVAVFQALGLFAGLILIARSAKNRNFIYLLVAAITLAAWMYPRHKLFDISLCVFAMGILTFLLENPTQRRFFITGACVGLIAVFGRNHGVYAVAGSLGAMLWLSIMRTEGLHLTKGFLHWSAGVIVGYTPLLLMALLIPGFAAAFWDGLVHLVERGGTNIPLPVPWPWRVDFSALPFDNAVRGVLVGIFFIAIVLFGVLSIAWVIKQKIHGKPVPPALVAAAFLALPYAHHAYSRADVAHLAQGIFPLLIGVLIILSTLGSRIKWSLMATLCGASLWVMHVYHPGWQCRAGSRCVDVEISQNVLRIEPGTAKDIALIRQLVEQYAADGQSFIATPFWPGAYALTARRSPMWEIYALFPQSAAFEAKEIERIKAAKPAFALVIDLPQDGREELRFRNTHPLVAQYIEDNFDRVQTTAKPVYRIYTARSADK